MSADEYCRDKAAPPGSNLYYSILFHPPELKQGLHALFAFSHEIQDTILSHSDPGIARLKLQWWHNEIDNLFAGQSRHPVGSELNTLRQHRTLDKTRFHESIEAAEYFLDPVQPENFDAWQRQHASRIGPVWQLAADICTCQRTESVQSAIMTGSLLCMLDTLQTLPFFLNKGYCILPRQEMQQYGVTQETLQTNSKEPAVHHLFTGLITTIRKELERVYQALPTPDRRPLLFSLINARLAIALCCKIEKDGCRLLDKRLGLTPLQKLWIAWNTRRQIKGS